MDGSVDALCDGKFGVLVKPDSKEEITAVIKKVIIDKETYVPDREEILGNFGYPVYK